MFLNNFLGFALVILSLVSINSGQSPIVQTDRGPVEGKISKTLWTGTPYFSFLGIPFAKPPVGKLRFQPPEDVEPWTDTLKSVEERSVCPQTADGVSKVYIGDEDCLYLNIYTPETNLGNHTKKRATMVYMFGGGFYEGDKNMNIYGPDFFMETDRVCIVLGNYRLSALGFASLQKKYMMGNQGLKDQRMILQWAKRNADAFGCDSESITLVGQSAGSASVFYHLISDQSKGLFHRLIGMSGTPLCSWATDPREKAKSRVHQLVDLLGHPDVTDEEAFNILMDTDAKDIVTKTEEMLKFSTAFRPTVDGDILGSTTPGFLTECAFEKFLTCDYLHMPIMMGYVKNEGLSFIPPYQLQRWLYESLTSLKNIGFNSEALPAPIKAIFNSTIDVLSEADYRILENIITKIAFIGPIDFTQRLIAECNRHPIYYYIFARLSNESYHEKVLHIPVPGVGHSDDLGALFRINEIDPSPNINNTENIYRRKHVRLWTNFIVTGHPTPDGPRDDFLDGVTWTDSRVTDQQLIIKEKLTMAKRQISLTTSLLETLIGPSSYVSTGCRPDQSLGNNESSFIVTLR